MSRVNFNGSRLSKECFDAGHVMSMRNMRSPYVTSTHTFIGRGVMLLSPILLRIAAAAAIAVLAILLDVVVHVVGAIVVVSLLLFHFNDHGGLVLGGPHDFRISGSAFGPRAQMFAFRFPRRAESCSPFAQSLSTTGCNAVFFFFFFEVVYRRAERKDGCAHIWRACLHIFMPGGGAAALVGAGWVADRPHKLGSIYSIVRMRVCGGESEEGMGVANLEARVEALKNLKMLYLSLFDRPSVNHLRNREALSDNNFAK